MQRTEGRGSPADAARDRPWQALREANILLRERFAHSLQGSDLSYSDFVALYRCERTSAKASDVARALGLTAAGTTAVIDRLETRRLVRRVPDPSDRRAVLIQVTSSGERMLAEADAVKATILRYLDRAMSAGERQALSVGLEAVLRALRNAPGSV